MTPGALFWLVLFALSAMLFFAIAAVVAVRGSGDLRELLRKSSRRNP